MGGSNVGPATQGWETQTDMEEISPLEVEAAGMTWSQLERGAQNRTRWRGVVAGFEILSLVCRATQSS